MKQMIIVGALLTLFSLAQNSIVTAAPRERMRLDYEWKFIVGDPVNAQASDFQDSHWRTVTLPHDWSIEGKLDPKAPMGGGGGFFPAGVGWYRQHITAPKIWQGKRVSVEFEGVYMNADVWLNGQHLATHPYGYTSFFVELTPNLKLGGSNILAVRVDNSQQKNSRWYSGSGIYRHVWLHVTNPVHVVPWGVFVTVPNASPQSATVNVQTTIIAEDAAAKNVTLQTQLFGPDGKAMASAAAKTDIAAGASQDVKQSFQLTRPALWSPEKPKISRTVTVVSLNGMVIDRVETPFGVRSIQWSAENGLQLNGVTYKLNGGCIHADNGPLGAAAFDRAEERKIELLKAAGYNEIRTAHHPPSPALLNACDRLGMLVMDEAFDCWAAGKNKFDYSVVFKDWWQRDLDAMVLRDRNHPAVVLWSTGNEIPRSLDPAMGGVYCQPLADRIRSLDPTRPVTQGLLGLPKTPEAETVAEQQRSALDIVGCNYNLNALIKGEADHPKRVLIATESKNGDPFDIWSQVVDNPFAVGDNVWSAQDYLGEAGIGRWFYEDDPTEPINPPRPGSTQLNPMSHGSDKLYPWHGAVCGDLDLIGDRRPMAHYRNIVWDRGEKIAIGVRQPQDDKKVIVVGWGWYPTWENWTWPGRDGKPMQVEVYSRYEKVRLYLNDTLIGEAPTTHAQKFKATFTVPYAPGTLKAVGVVGDKLAGETLLQTAGDPAAIRLTADCVQLQADGEDLSFVTVDVTDKNGCLQPNADQNITFSLTGPGVIAGVANADLKNEENYFGMQRPAFHGRALVVIRSMRKSGVIFLKAQATGLTPAQTKISVQ